MSRIFDALRQAEQATAGARLHQQGPNGASTRLAAFPSALEALETELLREVEVSSQDVVERARKRLEEKTAVAIEDLGRSAEAWLAALTAEFRQEGARQLEAEFQQVLARKRGQLVAQLETEMRSVKEQAVAQIRGGLHQAGQEACERLQKQVGLAVMVIKDAVECAKAALGADLQKSLEEFRRQAATAGGDLHKHRQDLKAMTESFLARLRKAAQLLSEATKETE